MAESVGEMMVGKMTTLFTMTDKDFDGLVCLEEFEEFNRVLEKLGKEPISSEKSTVTFDEFMELLTNRFSIMFDELDRNGNGSITKSELKKNGYCKEDIASFFRTYDLDSKHKEVSKAEYLTIMFEALCTSMNKK